MRTAHFALVGLLAALVGAPPLVTAQQSKKEAASLRTHAAGAGPILPRRDICTLPCQASGA